MIIRSTDQIKLANVDAVRKSLWGRDWSTVSQLVHVTNLSAPTVGRIIDEMLVTEEVLVSEVELITGGRRAKQYILNSKFSYALCVYIEKDIIWYDISDVAEESVERGELVVEEFRHRDIILDLIEEMLTRYPTLKAVSIGVPGWVYDDQLCYISSYPGLELLNFREVVEQEFNLPCRVSNDLNALVTGYYDIHCGEEGKKSLCGFYLSSTGPGAGLIIEGKLCIGKSGFAGEVASIPVHGSTLQEILVGDSPESEKILAIAKVVSTLIAICNIDIMLFCTFGDRLPDIELIKSECSKFIPGKAMPKFVTTNDYHTYYVYGLRTIANDLISENR